MERAEARAALEKAIVDLGRIEGWVDDSWLLTGFALVAAFDTGNDSTSYVYVWPDTQPHHHTVGLIHIAAERLCERTKDN